MDVAAVSLGTSDTVLGLTRTPAPLPLGHVLRSPLNADGTSWCKSDVAPDEMVKRRVCGDAVLCERIAGSAAGA
jgi:hypothetical protein